MNLNVNKIKLLFGKQVDLFAIYIAAAVIAFVNLRSPIQLSPDANFFIGLANILIQNNFDYVELFIKNKEMPEIIFYALPITLIALLKKLFINSWMAIYYGINLLSVFGVLEIFRKISKILNINKNLIAFFILLSISSIDLLIWPHYLLTDCIFTFLISINIYLIFKIAIKKEYNKICYLFLILIAIFITRPSSIPVVLSSILYLTFLKYFSKRIKLIYIFNLILITSIFYILCVIYLKDMSINSKILKIILEMIDKGIIIHDRPYLHLNISQSIFGFMIILWVRFFAFFLPVLPDFSYLHMLLNLLFFLPFFFSLTLFIKNSNLIQGTELQFINFLFILIFAYTIYHAATLIDYEWRYRFPILLPMLIINSLVFDNFLKTKNSSK